MSNKKSSGESINDKLELIWARLQIIEREMNAKGGSKHEYCCHEDQNNNEDGSSECCGLPIVPVRELDKDIEFERESLIRTIEKKWVNGTELKYCFFTKGPWKGDLGQQRIVEDAFDEWKNVGIGLSFTKVNRLDEADIRIGFEQGDGSWSYVGRDIWGISKSKRTMNFGWKLTGQSGMDTALHEIGHTLGFNHAQQNPFSGIKWDEDAVYRYFMGPPNNWSREKTFHNVLRTLNPESVSGSKWDPNSIMQYSIRGGLILRPERYQNGLNPEPGLSDTDKKQVRLFYPEDSSPYDQLRFLETKRLNINPAEQVNLVIRPVVTRIYQIQTFGLSDTVMVLFEDNNGTLEHVAGDDDSGWGRNASLKLRLVAGREYVLRIRLYYSHIRGESAVMYW